MEQNKLKKHLGNIVELIIACFCVVYGIGGMANFFEIVNPYQANNTVERIIMSSFFICVGIGWGYFIFKRYRKDEDKNQTV